MRYIAFISGKPLKETFEKLSQKDNTIVTTSCNGIIDGGSAVMSLRLTADPQNNIIPQESNLIAKMAGGLKETRWYRLSGVKKAR